MYKNNARYRFIVMFLELVDYESSRQLFNLQIPLTGKLYLSNSVKLQDKIFPPIANLFLNNVDL